MTGYVEFDFWLQYYCNPVNQGAMSQANWDYFGDVKMYRSKSDPTVNMEHLFTLINPDDNGDPAANSLFNLTSLQALINAGQNTVNVILSPDQTITDEILGDEWAALAETFALNDPDSNIGSKRAYLLWLWMQTAWDLTFARTQTPGGSFQIGVIGTLGATAFSTEMTTMSLEFPMLTLSSVVAQDFKDSGLDCSGFYTTNLGLTDDQATPLCTTSTNFTFSDSMQTAVALTNTYLYQGTFQPFYFNEFMSVSTMPSEGINATLYGDSSPWTTYFNSINSKIYNQYKDKACYSV